MLGPSLRMREKSEYPPGVSLSIWCGKCQGFDMAV